jgi:hypothetical protein
MVMMVERSLPVVEMGEKEDVVEYRGQKLTVLKSEWDQRQGVNGIPFSVGRQQLEYNRSLTPYKARGISSDVGLYWKLGSSMPMVRDALMSSRAFSVMGWAASSLTTNSPSVLTSVPSV